MNKMIAPPLLISEDELKNQEGLLLFHTERLLELYRQQASKKILNYAMTDLSGVVRLENLFEDQQNLIVLHSSGSIADEILWGDAFNGVFEHILRRAAFVLVSNDTPQEQHELALSRGWHFPMISAQGTSFSHDMNFLGAGGPEDFLTGLALFSKDPGNSLSLKNHLLLQAGSIFGNIQNIFALLPGERSWEPQASLWIH